MNERSHELLEIYLHDHIAGSVGGREVVRRAHQGEQQTEFGPPLKALQGDIEFDAQRLREIVEAMGVSPRTPLKESAAWVGAKLGGLKLNGNLIRRSPLSLLMELEGLQMAVNGKRALWQTLIELSRVEPKLRQFDIVSLLARADDQLSRIRSLHDRAARVVFDAQPEAAE